MAKVYFHPVNEQTSVEEVQRITKSLLTRMLADKPMTLAKRIPLKVHVGEKGNDTYIRPQNYQGIIDFLVERGCEPYYTETSVLYAGERYEGGRHCRLAAEHGFTQIPFVMADGEQGEDLVEVPIDKKHFSKCYLGRGIVESEQVVVLSHFKGHMLAGFGGAIKQLSMGCAARAGKLDMHRGVKPQIKDSKCKRCRVCLKRCNFGAITIGERSHIDHSKCKGCGACYAACPHKAIKSFSFFSLKSLINILFKGRAFREGLIEYAYAAHHGKSNLYINFVMNVTRCCDCDMRHMRKLIPDVGIYASFDPVALDSACYDEVAARGQKFAGKHQLAYAESIGLGEQKYELVEI